MPSQITDRDSEHDCTDPIFIFGIMQRSGTNFLKDVVDLHPDCGFPGHPLVEDYLAQNADWLVKYVKSVAKDWNALGRRVDYSGVEEELGHFLGNGILSFLQSRIAAKKRLLTKTPSVRNLKHFFRLFPKARLIIVVRDGRAVVESGVKSFGWRYEDAFHQWADAAASILEFEEVYKGSNYKYLIVRYEEVWNNLEEEVTKILNFLDLDRETYDFNTALKLPVRGSSTVRSESLDKMLWKAVEKPKDFNPLERWRNWDRARHDRFNWIAGDYMEAFGYELQYNSNQSIWEARNRALDVKWQAKSALQKNYRQFKQAFMTDRSP
jgi:hypothetical protein